jgi:hypothetical protein
MRRSIFIAGVCACLSLAGTIHGAPPRPVKPRPATKAEPSTSVDVTVVDVAGTQAYVRPGESGNVRRGASVTIDGRAHTVIATTASFAVIDTDGRVVNEGDKGRASIVDEQQEQGSELMKPRPRSAWKDAWPEAVAPASGQSPRAVPLGDGERDRRWDVRVMALGGAMLPLGPRGASFGRAELNARIHAEPFAVPFAFDADASVQQWIGQGLDTREGRPARPLVRVRELLLSYGNSRGFMAGFGRLRYAASTLGNLDGLRTHVALGGGFGLAAFGGLVPDPLSSAPSISAQRFGVEATYGDPERTLRPEVALVLHGSTFDGRLDERRLSGIVGIFPGRSRLGGHVEISGFDARNPWGASAVELTAGGVDASVRAGPFQVGARADIRQPERSRWLASFLPASWFCLTTPAAPGAAPGPEPCDGRVATRAQGSVDASVELDRFSLSAGGTLVRDMTLKQYPSTIGGFGSARVVRIARHLRADLTGSYQSGSYLDMLTISGGPGVTLLADQVDVSTYYRFGQLEYPAGGGSLTQHAAGAVVMLMPSPVLTLTVQGEGMTGDDARAVLLFTSVLWRPRF